MMNMEYGGHDGERSSKRRQHCTYCKNHGHNSRKTNHKCQYESCGCLLCQLTRLSRLIMRHQQRLWRHLKDSRRREDAAAAAAVVPGGDNPSAGGVAPGQTLASTSKQQKCDMCRNHGFMKEKRAHKNACPYQDCSCALCGLTKKRRDIMRHQQRVRRSQVTSQQRDEAYDYVVQTTAELAQLTMESAPTALDTPSTTTTMPTTTSTTTPTTLAPTCSTTSTLAESSTHIPAASTAAAGSVAPFKDRPPLELMENSPPPTYPARPDPSIPPPVEPRLHYDTTSANLDMGGYHHLGSSPAWRNLKRDRSEVDNRNPRLFRETSLFRNFDFMRTNNIFGREESVRNVNGLCGYDSVRSMDLVTSQEPPFRTQPSAADSSPALTVPLKKTRFTMTNEDLHLRYSQRFWGSTSIETSLSRGSEDVQHVGYRRMSVTTSPELRIRSPPALIPLPQNQPVRPHPVRPQTFAPSMEWDPVSLPYLAYSLLHTRNYNGTLPTSPFGLGKVAPFLHSSVP